MSNNIKNKGNKKVSVKKTEKKSQAVLYRLMMVLALDIIAVSLFITIKNEAAREYYFVSTLLPVLRIVFAGLSVLAIGYWIFTKVKKIDISKHICTPLMIAGTMISGLLISLLYTHGSISIQKIIIAIIAVSLLYFIYYLYKRNFWIYAVYTAGAYLLISLLSGGTYFSDAPALHVAVKITALVIALAFGIFVLAAKAKGGTLSFGKNDICLFEDRFDVLPFAVTTGMLLISAVISFFTTVFSVYMSILLLASFLVIAIIYTVRMI